MTRMSSMNARIFATILLGCICAVYSSTNAVKLQAVDYIDASEIDWKHEPYRALLRDLVEKHGSENPNETAKFIKQLSESLQTLEKNKSEDKFRLKGQLRRLRLNASKFRVYVEAISNIVSDPEIHFKLFNLDAILDMIKTFFGHDLQGFASGQTDHDSKLHAFLLKYAEIIVSNRLSRSMQMPDRSYEVEDSMEDVVAHDLRPGYTEADLISKAQGMNLARDEFSGYSMLASIEGSAKPISGGEGFKKFEPAERLHMWLVRICSSVSFVYGRTMKVYTWARLLIPGQVAGVVSASKDLPHLVEFWRVCLPVVNYRRYNDVAGNIKRNIDMENSIMNILNKHSRRN